MTEGGQAESLLVSHEPERTDWSPVLLLPALTAAAALVALLGWIFHLPSALSSPGDFGRMAPDTSAMFLGLAAFLLLTLAGRARKWRIVGSACFTAVSLVVLFLNAFGWLDLTERAALGTLGFLVPGAAPIMSPVTSVAFVLCGLALWTMSLYQPPLPKTALTLTVVCGTAVATLGSVCLVLFALRFPVGNSWLLGRWMLRMALETSLLFTLCGGALVWAAGRRRARDGQSVIFPHAGIAVCLWLLLLLVGVNTTLNVALQNNLKVRDAVREGQQSQAGIQSLVASVREAESGQRGYLLTSDPVYLRSFDAGQAEARQALGKRLSVGEQWPEVDALRGVARKKLAELSETVALQQSGHAPEARALIQTGRGRDLMDRLEDLRKLIDQRLDEQTGERNAAYWGSANLVRRTVIASYGLALALLICAAAMVRSEIRRRTTIERALRASEAGLEARMTERTTDWQASEANFRLLTNTIPQIVWRSNASGVVEFYNERWYELTGAPRDVQGDRGWVPYVHPDDLAAGASLYQAALREARAFENELRLWDAKRHEFRRFLVRSLPLRDEHGNVTGWLGTSTDIHDLREKEPHQASENTAVLRSG